MLQVSIKYLLCVGLCSRGWGGKDTATDETHRRLSLTKLPFQDSFVSSDTCLWKQWNYFSSGKFWNALVSSSLESSFSEMTLLSSLQIVKCLNGFKMKIYYSPPPSTGGNTYEMLFKLWFIKDKNYSYFSPGSVYVCIYGSYTLISSGSFWKPLWKQQTVSKKQK